MKMLNSSSSKSELISSPYAFEEAPLIICDATSPPKRA